MGSICRENLEQCLAHCKDSIYVSYFLVYILWMVILQGLADDYPPLATVLMYGIGSQRGQLRNLQL